MTLNTYKLREQIRDWLEEDIGPGDITSHVTVPEDLNGTGIIHSKGEGILTGIPILKEIFSVVDPNVEIYMRMSDGDILKAGDVVAVISGNVRSILSGERLALNLLQRLSGIATKTNHLVQAAREYNPNVRVVEARKTTPGLRMLEKYAVRVGGGHSHRYGLFDAVLIKDNHIKAAGGLKQAIGFARTEIPHTMKVEVEVESVAQVIESLEAKADIIMFDNMPMEEMRKAIALIGDQAITEASGGITIENIAEVAQLGVNVISMGSLTYSVNNVDISLDLFDKKCHSGIRG